MPHALVWPIELSFKKDQVTENVQKQKFQANSHRQETVVRLNSLSLHEV